MSSKSHDYSIQAPFYSCRFYADLEKQKCWLVLTVHMGTTRVLFKKSKESEKQVDGCVFLVPSFCLHTIWLLSFCGQYSYILYSENWNSDLKFIRQLRMRTNLKFYVTYSHFLLHSFIMYCGLFVEDTTTCNIICFP